jgi:hypothetical protein
MPETLMRDAQGVYHFNWREVGATTGNGTPAAISLLKLAQGSPPHLEIPASGDPTLYITENTPIQVAGVANPTPGTQSRGSDYIFWRPFYGGYYYGPRYYDPPMQSIPSTSSGSTIDGSRSSTAPLAPSQRTAGISHGVSGQAGGAGSGSAATNKSGASASGGGKSNSVAPASSGFSSGRSSSSAGSSSGGSSSSASS